MYTWASRKLSKRSSNRAGELPAAPRDGEFARDRLYKAGDRGAVVTEQALECGEREALLNGCDRERVPQHVRRDRPADAGAVGHTLHEALDRPRRRADGL